jgi:hypothetical protein
MRGRGRPRRPRGKKTPALFNQTRIKEAKVMFFLRGCAIRDATDLIIEHGVARSSAVPRVHFRRVVVLFANDNFRASKGELCAAFVELSVQVLTLFRRKTLARLKIVRPTSGSASVVANWQMAVAGRTTTTESEYATKLLMFSA